MAKRASLSTNQWEFWDQWMTAHRMLARELERALQREFAISKAEFSILVTLQAAEGTRMRVTELADVLDWDKSRVAHQLSRMERRGLVAREEAGSPGRRTGIELTDAGTDLAARAVDEHGRTIRRLTFDRLSSEQAAAIGAWSRNLIEHLDGR